ncbi:hypothetical protein ILUMI_18343 [Ignelater luminosus]|uniref:HTH psq-type domain-containing protein n=1 Tax=Ignelater luminosus TaxID=2038154 RepID=A0A8K0CQD5_IGNLU|nr:hypothetical protein ILUMI_18343 [Ignelater luminosus]
MHKYKKKLGSKNYKNYSSETLTKALNEIRSKKLSLNQASAKYGICKGTLSHKLREKHNNTKPGRPNVLDDNEEKALVHIVIETAEWGFPVTVDDLRHIVKAYLDKQRRTVGEFRQNMPGKDWNIALSWYVCHHTLKELWDTLLPNSCETLKGGFRITGNFPINKDQVLKKLPKDVSENDNGNAISDSLLEFLQKNRNPNDGQKGQRKKHVNVEPWMNKSDDKNYLESLREELAENKREEEAILTHNTIKVGDYILVRFATKRTVNHYVGENQVQEWYANPENPQG